MWQKTIEIIDGLATFAAPVQSTKNNGYTAESERFNRNREKCFKYAMIPEK